jgi:hypothetical protein
VYKILIANLKGRHHLIDLVVGEGGWSSTVAFCMYFVIGHS